ncbi:uncharacterized protein PAF06_017135 [Gastrophryne carolinensis]
MNELYQLYGIERSRTTPYHPQGNGACERFNRTLIQMLRTLENGQKARWPEYLPELMWAYNNRVHNTTGYSPHMLMFGRAGREVEDLHMPDPKEPQPRSATAWMQEHRRRLRAIHKVVGERLEQVVHPAPGPVQRDSYSPGDRVMVRAKRPSGKLDGRWEAVPYMVKRRVDPDIPVYEVEPVGTGGPSRNLHRNMLRQCNFDEPNCIFPLYSPMASVFPNGHIRQKLDHKWVMQGMDYRKGVKQKQQHSRMDPLHGRRLSLKKYFLNPGHDVVDPNWGETEGLILDDLVGLLEEQEPVQQTMQIPHRPSTFTPSWTNNQAIQMFYNLVSKDIRELKSNNRHNNLTKLEWEALRSLQNRDDLIIKEADKGGNIVILS